MEPRHRDKLDAARHRAAAGLCIVGIVLFLVGSMFLPFTILAAGVDIRAAAISVAFFAFFMLLARIYSVSAHHVLMGKTWAVACGLGLAVAQLFSSFVVSWILAMGDDEGDLGIVPVAIFIALFFPSIWMMVELSCCLLAGRRRTPRGFELMNIQPVSTGNAGATQDSNAVAAAQR